MTVVQRFLSLLVISVPLWCAAQVNPEDDDVFRSREISEIRITMDADHKIDLLDDVDLFEDIYYPCDLTFQNSRLNETVQNVGIRLRGNTSRNHPKRSFKIDFREFGGEKFHDYKKFNLKAENNDPSVIREHLALEIFRLAGVPAARSHHVKLYINDEYMGLYLNVEQIDDEFVQERFGNDEGNLYKCYWGSTLEDDGQVSDDGRYELKTNEEVNNRAVLRNMVEVLNQNESPNWTAEFGAVFNIDRFIKYLAAEALLGHWDGYSYNKNNFYLYEDPESGLVEFITYDVDNTFGIDWVSRDWSDRDVLDWPRHGDPRPLVANIMAVEHYRNRYIIELTTLLDGIFSEAYLYPIFDSYRTLLSDANATDPYFPLTFGFSHQTFLDSHDQDDITFHLPYALRSYVEIRSQSARDQIPDVEVVLNAREPIPPPTIYPNPTANNVVFVITTSADPQISVSNLSGKGVQHRLAPGSGGEWVILLDNVTSGIYIIQVDGTRHKLRVGR